jgi:Zn-dependent oligopeptidase
MMSNYPELKNVFFNEVEEIQTKVCALKKEMSLFIENLNIRQKPITQLKKLIAFNEEMDFLQNSIQIQQEFFPLNNDRGEKLLKINTDITTFKSKLYSHDNVIDAFQYIQKTKTVEENVKKLAQSFAMIQNISLEEKAMTKKMANLTTSIETLAKKFVKNTEDLGKNLEHSLHFTKNEIKKLKGLHKSFITEAKETAQKYNKEGALFLYNEDVFYTIIFSVHNREVRKIAYEYILKANSHINKKYDNDKILSEIFVNRQKMAQLHNYADYSELTISKYLISTSKEILNYLAKAQEDLSPAYQNYLTEIQKLAKKDNIENLQAWDIFYYNGLLTDTLESGIYTEFSEYFDRDYFFKAFFKLISKQFNLTIKDIDAKEFLEGKLYKKLHDEVFAYELTDNVTGQVGYLLLDKFFSNRKKENRFICYNVNSCYDMDDNTLSKPVGYISLALNKEEPCLGFYEMKTIMHEFGHFLHFNLKSPMDANLSWDLIEVPSQFMEQWMYNYETVKTFSNLEGKKLPKKVFNTMIKRELYLDIANTYGSIEKYIKKIELHQNIANITTHPSEAYQLEYHLERNITRDLYMLAEDYKQEYAATEYVYFYSEGLAFQLYKAWVESGAHRGTEQARALFTEVFNHPVEKSTRKVFSKIVNLKENNILELITKGMDVKLLGLN